MPYTHTLIEMCPAILADAAPSMTRQLRIEQLLTVKVVMHLFCVSWGTHFLLALQTCAVVVLDAGRHLTPLTHLVPVQAAGKTLKTAMHHSHNIPTQRLNKRDW